MNENLNLDAIRQLLNRSLGQLDQPTLASLRKAREQALLRHTHSGAHARWKLGTKRYAAVTWFATLLLVVSLFGGVTYYWQQTHDNSEIDLAILTDDMPIDVYVE
ncbi:MAG TPA: DUF3619 family protein [Gallionellaceae bacterium]|nr:DUF3619 family protein [Gallionellaceae bacterium]